MTARYVYLGDRLTDPRLVGQPCDPVYRADRTPVTVIVGRRPRNQLVIFPWGEKVVVLGRRLRLTSKEARPCPEPGVRPTLAADQREHDADSGRAVPGRVGSTADPNAVERRGSRASADPTCNGWCQPARSLYEGRCPAHGFRALIDALTTTSETPSRL